MKQILILLFGLLSLTWTQAQDTSDSEPSAATDSVAAAIEAAEAVVDSAVTAIDSLAGDEEAELSQEDLLKSHEKQKWRSVTTVPTLSQARPRTFNPDKLNDYANDSDYQYDLKQPDDRLSWWERFKEWLREIFRQMFDSVPGGEDTRDIILYIIAGALLVFAILKFIGADPRGLFGRKAASAELPVEEVEADIHSISFEDMIAEAVRNQQYKRAVRLFYLKTLKQLSDREWIDWRPYKTNYEYIRELKRNDLSGEFRQVTQLFEYIWYGDFPLNNNTFKDAENQFKNFEKLIQK